MITIADVLFTRSDETYYVLNGQSEYAKRYKAVTMKETIELLKNDGWGSCGGVNRHDGSIVDMLRREDEYIAVWKE